MSRLEDFTTSAIDSRLPFKHRVANYESRSYCGIVHISWNVKASVGWNVLTGLVSYGVVPLLRAGIDAFKDTNHKYFDCVTGEHLADNRDNAAHQLNKIGLQYFGNNEFNKAFDYFNNAYQLSASGSNNEFKGNRELASCKIEEVAEASKTNATGLRFWEEGNWQEAKKHFESAHQNSPNDVQFSKNLKMSQDKIAEVDAAEKRGEILLQEGKELWEKAWLAEKEDNCELAESKFNLALNTFSRCCVLKESSAHILQELASWKIEGNALFNEGLHLQQKVNDFLEDGQVEAAMKEYCISENRLTRAMEYFSLGMQNSDNRKRFSESKELAEEYLNALNQAMLRQTMGKQAIIPKKETEDVNEKVALGDQQAIMVLD